MPRPMLRVPPRQYYYAPYKTQCKGFNTEFSLHEILTKIEQGKDLDEEQQVFYDYLKIKGIL